MNRFLLLAFYCLWVSCISVDAQPIYNQKNITQDVLTEHYDNPVPMQVMEYSTDQNGTIIERRLEILPENGLPSARVRIINDQFEEIPLVNQPPFDALFDNGLFDIQHCVDAATLLFGTEVALKVIKDKFGWSGLDNQGVNGKAIIWNIMAPNSPSIIASPYYSLISKEFNYLTNGTEADKLTHIEAVTHELVHGIINAKIGDENSLGLDPCGERKVVAEALCDILGLYVRNEYEQNSPALYIWTLSQGYIFPGRSFDNPNSNGQPDTYYGSYYANSCPGNGTFIEHQNATVIDHWYYLLASGTVGTETNDLGYSYKFNGIGVNKAIQIVWKCLDYIGKHTSFSDLKKASLTIAEQLYGLHSIEYLAVVDAWCAVGICENNLGPFYMSPAHGAAGVEPWPGVKVNVIWEGKPVTKWEVQMDTDIAFSNPQTVVITNFTTVINPDGGAAYSGFATGYFAPGERVYARARIIEAEPDFCKGYNPLCVLYQQYGPAHAFTLDDKKVQFWHLLPLNYWTANPWNSPTIQWKSVPNAQQYTFEVSEDDAFTKIIYTETVPSSGNFSESGTISTVLEAGTTLFTRVRAENANSPQVIENVGEWSDMDTIKVMFPRTSVYQALNQMPGDPPTAVSTLGFWVGWLPYPGTSHYVIQIATDPAFANIVRTQNAAGNLTAVEMLLPAAPDKSNFFVRVLPQKGSVFGVCDHVWRIQTDGHAVLPKMKGPPNGSVFPFNAFAATFEWQGGSLNLNLVKGFEFHFKKKNSNLTSIFPTGKVFDILIKDPLLFDNPQGFEVAVLAVNELGAKSALSAPFSYTICPDHPAVFFPGDLGKVDPTLDFNVQWHHSASFPPGSQYLVTIMEGVTPLPGFNNKPTTQNFMLVPAGKLTNGKSYTVTVKNSSSCAGILLPKTFFNAVGSGGSNQPQPPKLVDFQIDLKGFRNDPDGTVFPPEFGTSNYEIGIELFDPNGTPLGLHDPTNGNAVTYLEVDSQNSGVILVGDQKPQGKYKLRLKMKAIFDPLLYYPFDQPWFSVSLNGQVIVSKHIITVDFVDPASLFNEWQVGFQFADIVLDVK
ncbi:M4 family metallopeptidase [Dyadobacter sp. 676]|uniref:M4 family metallopeptidase n=1 Tax=Dyadobacter sp. 676 TaxID=3088362 RepID=A0AAU8FR07_9BACT